MPTIAVKLYSALFKLSLKHKLLRSSSRPSGRDGYGLPRPLRTAVPANASFSDGVATKDVNIDPFSPLSLRIFLPLKAREDGDGIAQELSTQDSPAKHQETRRNRRPYSANPMDLSAGEAELSRRRRAMEASSYQGYVPASSGHGYMKLPVIIQFHGGAFVTGSKDSAANDAFCRRLSKLCHSIVIAVDHRLAPQHKYPAAFEDGFEALCWIAKQANLAECSKSFEYIPAGFLRNGSDIHRLDLHRELVDSFGASIVEPWLAAHGDFSRCVLLGVSSGGNIADYVVRRAISSGRLLEPIKIVAQVLMCPFFIGSTPTRSELKLADSYFYDKATCILAWKLFLPDGEYDTDHPAANPLIHSGGPPLKEMPPTLIVVAELDWMKDRAIAYSEALRRANIDAPVLEYKDAVHEFATLDFLVNSQQAGACAEDVAIWVKKYISLKGHEFSY